MLFSFAAFPEFRNRTDDLTAIEQWWGGPDRNALALYGRRRVGKSWLFRAFAHDKRALILVSDQRAQAAQLARFGTLLSPHFDGVEPHLPDLASLFRALYAIGEREKTLVVIDEFPYLLPSRQADANAVLTTIQAVMEERDASQLKLILCGSHLGQMAKLLSESSPIRGRLTARAVAPLSFAEAQAFCDEPKRSAIERIERYAVSGGMSLYLNELSGPGPIEGLVSERVLNHRGPLFDDPRDVLEAELRQPGVFFSILEEVSGGQRGVTALSAALGIRSAELAPYLKTLGAMELIVRCEPMVGSADLQYRVADNFLRFWFRFVFPFQADLRTGVQPAAHFATEVAPVFGEHVAPVFEALGRQWVRETLGISRVGSWWGNARNDLRKQGVRSTEEIDIVGIQRAKVVLVGECKWTRKPMGIGVLDDLDDYKVPALAQSGAKLRADLTRLLVARSGFSDALVQAAQSRDDVRLVNASTLVANLLGAEE